MAKLTKDIIDWQNTVRVAKRWSNSNFEPAFEKNSAFNKDFGTEAGTVAEGNHTHDSDSGDISIKLEDITDVVYSSLEDKQFLNYNGDSQEWENTPNFYIDSDGNLVFEGNILATGEIQAHTDAGQLPDDIWDSMPYATENSIGGVKVIQSTSTFEDGIRLNNDTKKLQIDPTYSSQAKWGNISGTLSDQTDLQSELDGKSDTGHGHTIDDVNDLQSSLDDKSNVGHDHSISDVNDLQTELDGKSDTDHGHIISDITDLESSLDDKLDIIDFNDLFELKNDGSTDYIQAKYDFFGVGDIVAYSSADAEVEPIWSNMPYATADSVGGVKIIQSDTDYENGIRLNATTKKLEINPEYSDSFDESDNYNPSGDWDFTGTLNYGGNNVATESWVSSNYNYYDDSDVDAHLSGGTGINYSDGSISIDSTVATESWVDDNYHPLGGSSSLNFEVDDLIIHGQVNQWNEEVITVDDASLQLNAIQDGARVESGIIIFDSDTSTELSKLYYDTDDDWKIDGNIIATQNWVEDSATANNSNKLNGYSGNDYVKKDFNQTITGEHTFKNDLIIDDAGILKSFGDGATRTIFQFYGFSDTHHLDLRYYGGNYEFMTNDTNRDIKFNTPDGHPILYLNSDTQNVGIGKLSSGAKLDVDGNILAQGEIIAYADGNLDLSNIYTYEVESSSNTTEEITPDEYKNKLQLRVIRTGNYSGVYLDVNLDNLTGNLNVVEGTIYLHSDEDYGGEYVRFYYKNNEIKEYSETGADTTTIAFKFIYDNELDEFINVY